MKTLILINDLVKKLNDNTNKLLIKGNIKAGNRSKTNARELRKLLKEFREEVNKKIEIKKMLNNDGDNERDSD